MELTPDKIKGYMPYIIFVFFTIIYLITLSPTVSFIDSDELATVCCTLGIAHPTGYPLFTLVGHIFSKFTLFNSEIYTLNLMCAFFCSIGLFFFYKFANIFYSDYPIILNQKNKKINKNDKLENEIKFVAVIASVLSLGLSKNYWFQSTSIEVYPLHILIEILALFLFIVNIQKPIYDTEKLLKENIKGWIVLSFILGLGFTNHMSIIYLIPAFAFLYFYEYRFCKNSFKLIGILIIPFLLALTIYIYLPIRASSNPILNWGDPSTLEKFKWHVTGKQYSVWIFSSISEMFNQIKYFFKNLPEDYLYLPVLISVIGLINLFSKNRKYFYFTIILFLTCFLLAINYSIVDIDSYFILAYIIISLWVGSGILYFYSLFFSGKKYDKVKVMYLFLIIPAIEIFNFSKVDESNNYLVEDYTLNLFKSVKPNGIVVSYQWDNWISASYYFQHVKNIRKDIVVIDKELCRRSWYIKQLERNYPWLIEKSRDEVNDFLKEVYKFEHDEPYNSIVIEEKFVNMLNSFIKKNINTLPVYVTNEIEREIDKPFRRVPEGLVYRLYPDEKYYEFPDLDFKFRPYKKGNRYGDMLMSFYGIMLTNRASYEFYFNHKDRALQWLDKLQKIHPDFGPAISLKRIINGSNLYYQ